jgi:hypothetical protein
VKEALQKRSNSVIVRFNLAQTMRRSGMMETSYCLWCVRHGARFSKNASLQGMPKLRALGIFQSTNKTSRAFVLACSTVQHKQVGSCWMT